MVNVKYETTTDFTVIPTVKSVKSGKFKRAEKKKKLSFKKTVNIDDLGEDEF
jgi:hypothetical protein